MRKFFVIWLLFVFMMASFFVGIIAHEIVHIWQFGFNVVSIGVLWGVQPEVFPFPAFYVTAGQGVQQIENMERIGDIVQLIVTVLFFISSLLMFHNYEKKVLKSVTLI